jgi:putative transposase
MAVFQTDEDRRCYLQFLGEEAGRFGVEILAWCLMTNHVHFIAVPKKADSLARAFGEAHRRYTRMKDFKDQQTSKFPGVELFWEKEINYFHLLGL